MLAVGLLVAVGCAAGIAVPATHGTQTTADEPQYLLTAISLATDRDLDIADELAGARWRPFHALPLPEQTEPLADGRRLSPHDPLLPLMLAAPVAVGGWVGAKLAMAAMAGLLAALLLWTAVRRLGVPVPTATLATAVFACSPPLAIYGSQLYPELPAALAALAAVAALIPPPQAPNDTPEAPDAPATAAAPEGLSGRATLIAGAAVVALPWLAVKYVPVAATLAVVAGWRLARAGQRRRVLALAAALAAAGIAFLVLHRWWYGGWTPYQAGDHFTGGELTAVGADPDYLGRSRRLLGLLVDRSFGLAAWQPAWLLAVPALAVLLGRRPRGWAALAALLATGWLVATFLALTMHGWWSPGRQVVVVLPPAALAVAWWAGQERRRRLVLTATGGIGLLAYGWLVAEGAAGRITWAVDFADTANPLYRAWRLVLPDYLAMTWWTWPLHAAWLIALAVCAAAAGGAGQRLARFHRLRTRQLREA
ncbi:MAG TPA: hypothetical protein VGS14_02735 [Actinomycetes bacterium]|jgi:hypothetical protein|nr:hypothetical protein [Actinomycetes bacterium]